MVISSDPLAMIGWVQDTPASMVDVDAVGHRHWGVGRLWSMPGQLSAPVYRDGVFRAVVGVDGIGTVRHSAREITVRPRELIIVPATESMIMSNESPWTRIVWQFESVLLHQKRFAGALRHVHTLSEPYWGLFGGLTYALARSGPYGWERGSTFLNHALSNIVTAAVAETLGADLDLAAKDPTGMYRRALRVIDENYLHRDFTVTILATELALSLSHLHRVFSEQGSTPAREIEIRRVGAAKAILAAAPESAQQLDWLAARTGFSTVRRMRTALSRHRHKSSPD